jgi:histone acetyltransferase MYST1
LADAPNAPQCQIIDMNQEKTKFYVHWTDFNRRLDNWIDKDKVDFECTKEQMKEIRERKRRFDDLQHERHEDHEGLGEADLKEHEELTKVKNVNKLQFGKYLLETWYFTPLPREIWKQGDDIIEVLYMCEFCLSFYKTKDELERHQKRDKIRHPPGDEIYRNGKVSVFEVDGEKSRTFATLPRCSSTTSPHPVPPRRCRIARRGTHARRGGRYLYYDVDPFLFYVVCEYDSQARRRPASRFQIGRMQEGEGECRL